MKKSIIALAAAATLFTVTAGFASASSDANVNIKINKSISISKGRNDDLNHDHYQHQTQRQSQSQSLNSVSPELVAIATQIILIKNELLKCNLFSYRNLELREELVQQYKAAYELTKNDAFLEIAIDNARIAELNYQRGSDIKRYQSFANQTIHQVYRDWTYCIWKLYKDAAAEKFAATKGVKTY